MSGQCLYYTIRGELAWACQVAKELLEFGEARNDRDATFQGCASGAVSWFHVGDFVAARSGRLPFDAGFAPKAASAGDSVARGAIPAV
jgi:hypothetical protein